MENGNKFRILKEELYVSTFEKVKEHFEIINLNRYDLGGCEIGKDD